MKRLLTLVAFFATIQASAQQVNPVPDYVFRNQMSVGRGTVTDTAAYFSIGPRYGATKGFMPPIVGDTATFSSGKRNGLLIFSVQKNKFLYWDSVRVQWSDMAGSSGAYIVAGDTSAMLAPYLRKADTTSMLTAYLRKGDTASMLSPYYRSATASAALALKLNISDTSSMLTPYIRHAGYGLTKSGQSFLVDTLNIATRAWRQKGLDSLAALEVSGSGTTNYVPKFTASSTIGNSQIFDNGTNVGIGTASPLSKLEVSGETVITNGSPTSTQNGLHLFFDTNVGYITSEQPGTTFRELRVQGSPLILQTAGTERLRIFANGRVFIGASPTDAGYQLDINGTLRSVNGANFATTSGEVLIGTTSDAGDYKLQVAGNVLASDVAGAYPRFVSQVGAKYWEMGYRSGTTNYEIREDGTTRLVIANGGNVGVGITADNPLGSGGTYRNLMVGNGAGYGAFQGVSTATAAGSTLAAFMGGTTGASSSFKTAGYMAVELDGTSTTNATGRITFTVGQSTGAYLEAMRITSSGELLINTTSDAGDYKLQVSGNIYNTGSAVLAATSGELLVGTTSDAGDFKIQTNGAAFFGVAGTKYAIINNSGGNTGLQSFGDWTNHLRMTYPSIVDFDFQVTSTGELDLKRSSTVATRVNSAREFMINTTTDAGDYHLQVVGNARVGTGKLDIASNTVFGLGVARSGTSEVAGQIYNSSGILYLGAESSAGGQIFSGSSAYAAVIGSGANYPLQFAANNITRATLTTNGNFMIGFPTDTYFYRLQVNGSIFSNNQIIAQNAAAQLNIDSSTNISPLYISNQSLTGSSAQGLFYGSTTWNTTGNPSLIDLAITNTASGSDANYIKISDGSNIFRVTKAAEVVTAAPTGGSIRKWKLGEAATVSPTSPNRTIRVEIDGTVYYLHAKTTND